MCCALLELPGGAHCAVSELIESGFVRIVGLAIASIVRIEGSGGTVHAVGCLTLADTGFEFTRGAYGAISLFVEPGLLRPVSSSTSVCGVIVRARWAIFAIPRFILGCRALEFTRGA